MKKTFIPLLCSTLILSAENTVKDHSAMFEKMDVNNDDRVTKSEFWGLWNTFFAFRDKDENLELSDAEYFVKKGKNDELIFKQVDKDEDGVVSIEEEKAFRMKHFQVLDADKDENLDIEEITVNAKG